jgi:excisionase family DNA binding protein
VAMLQNEREEWLTPEELADILRVPCKTVKSWATWGRIPSLRLSYRVLRFNYAAVIAALKAEHPEAWRVDDGEEEG